MIYLLLYFSLVASYTPFFKEAWEKKEGTEKLFNFATDDEYNSSTAQMLQNIGRRAPSALPQLPYKDKPYFGTFGVKPSKNHMNNR